MLCLSRQTGEPKMNNPKFIPDTNDWGPFIDGRSFVTGVLVKPGYRYVRTASKIASGMYYDRLIGTWAYAESLNGKVTRTSEWHTTS